MRRVLTRRAWLSSIAAVPLANASPSKPMRGIFIIMSTPFTESGAVDYEDLEREVVKPRITHHVGDPLQHEDATEDAGGSGTKPRHPASQAEVENGEREQDEAGSDTEMDDRLGGTLADSDADDDRDRDREKHEQRSRRPKN
jgi:hypothetical protein